MTSRARTTGWLLGLAAASVAACSDDAGPADAADVVDSGTPIADTAADDAQPPDTASDGDTSVAVTTQQWCIRSNTIWCDWMYACLDEEDLATAERALGVDASNCASRLTADCQARTQRSVLEGRQSFDGDAAGTCIVALEQEPCGTWAELVSGDALNPEPCHGITAGLVEPGGDCTNTLDCAATDAWCWSEPEAEYGTCSDTLGSDAFQWECNADNGDQCAGRVCTLLPENASDWVGICSAHCRVDRNCGPGAGCFTGLDGERMCLALCTSADDCAAGLECQDVGGRDACFVPPA